MTGSRGEHVEDFIEALKAAFMSSRELTPAIDHFLARLYEGLAAPVRHEKLQSQQLPVCDHLASAYKVARSGPPEIARLASALEDIASTLAWKVRASGGPHSSINWPDGHANAVIIGAGGLQQRGDVMIGASLLAPDVRYPDHNHPPEELYMVMTPGRFQHGGSPWYDLRPGQTFHNVPNIKHAMASGDSPLLAIWTMVNV